MNLPTTPGGPDTTSGMRWLRPAATAQGQDANSLLTACHQHLADEGSAIIIGAAGTTYSEREQLLLSAGRAAGHHLHDIIPLGADDGRDAFTCATTRDTAAPSRDSGSDSDVARQATCTTLVIFGHPGRRP